MAMCRWQPPMSLTAWRSWHLWMRVRMRVPTAVSPPGPSQLMPSLAWSSMQALQMQPQV